MATPRIVFPVTFNPQDAKLIERAKRLDGRGRSIPGKPSRSAFLREAALGEARKRLGLAKSPSPRSTG